MNNWSARLFRSDSTMDIIGDYEILLSYGVDSETAFSKIKKAFFKEYFESGEEDVFWITLAYVNWKYGIKNNYVLEKAFEFIDNKDCMGAWAFENEKTKSSRLNALAECKYNLQFVKRTYKKPPKPPLALRQKTTLQEGDVIAYQLGSTYSEEIVKNVFKSKPHLIKKWVLLCVVKIFTKSVTKIMPELDYKSFAIVTFFDKLFDEKALTLPSDIKLRKIISNNCAGNPEEYGGINLDEIAKREYKHPANIELIGKYYTSWNTEGSFDGNYREIDHSSILMF